MVIIYMLSAQQKKCKTCKRIFARFLHGKCPFSSKIALSSEAVNVPTLEQFSAMLH